MLAKGTGKEHHCRGRSAAHHCAAAQDLERYGQKDQNYFLVTFGCCVTSLFKVTLSDVAGWASKVC